MTIIVVKISLMQLGNKIKTLRELKKLTQKQIADSIGISQGAYSRLELGETEVTYSKLVKIAKELNMAPEEIIAFNEGVVINVMNNQTGNGLVIHNQDLPEEEKNLFKAQIDLLKLENTHLKYIIENLLKK